MAIPDPQSAAFTAVVCWISGGLLTVALERLIRPRITTWRRRPAAWMIQFGLWTLAYGLLLAISQRPLFAVSLALAGALLVVLVNNAKYRALREPFLFSDFGLFSQAIRHPRLYLPFLGAGKAVLGGAAITASLYLGLSLEPPLPERTGWWPVIGLVAAMLTTGGLFLWRGGARAPAPVLDPEADLQTFGLAASLWLYWRQERRPMGTMAHPVFATYTVTTDAGPVLPDASLPHIVAVQNESFFDARRLWPAVQADLLARFDKARESSVMQGRLTVPAWGANTMRTEFGFLTGLPARALGVHRFNPYRLYARRPVASLASTLRARGYRTVCIHPHPASFFARDKVFPQLGFDDFIDIHAFDTDPRCGPYICDMAVGERIAGLLDQSPVPLFVFAITMENHGPLHLEQVTAVDEQRLYTMRPPAGFDDLTVYLRHLVNADAMLGGLIDTLSSGPRDGLLCWFGDHVPSMPAVYEATGFADGRTDYLIWHSRSGPHSHPDLPIEELGPAMLDIASITTGPMRSGRTD